jgi:(E)-4-hydroxy-3-methylbut-2-enyl-diphosphate synthase
LLCKERGVSIRIGTNHGSLSDRIMNYFGDTPEGMVESALEFALIAEKYDFHNLIFSMKASNPKVMVQAYRLLAARLDAMSLNYPFHLGVTEAGNAEDGRIKSAIGIGSLLEDGIGDTIRVSLTEDPEYEIPVALRLARRYTPIEQSWLDLSQITDFSPVAPASQWPQPSAASSTEELLDNRDPFHYKKLEARLLEIDGVALGGENVPQVVATLATTRQEELLHKAHGAGRSLVMAAQPKRKPEGEADLFLYPLEGIDKLKDLKKGAGTPLPILVTVQNVDQAQTALENGADALQFSTIAPLTQVAQQEIESIAQLSVKQQSPLWLKVVSSEAEAELQALSQHQFKEVATLLQLVESCRAQGQEQLVLALGLQTTAYTLRSYRLLAARLQERGWNYPVHLVAPMAYRIAHPDDVTTDASIALGGLLIDGIGSSVEIAYPDGSQLTALQESQLAFNILQAAGARSSKAEYIACPSCGRTLFDLQSTTERIKAQTKHLVGVKIAIMGCIVNGLGELADADFGYMGGAVGKVNLFVGKECVEKGVPTDIADHRLIELIKEHGRWVEPE